MKSAFISIEGVDGAGKTTHINFIEQWLSEYGAQVVLTREPGGTLLGEQLRLILLSNDTVLSLDSELLLIFAARAQHLNEIILPALEAGKCVLCDRFIDATYAYQGGGRGIDTQRIEVLEKWTQKEVQPDLTIWLDVPVEIGLARTNRRKTLDRFERENLEFKQAVWKTYHDRAARFNRIQKIDSNRAIEQVQNEIRTVLTNFRQQWQD